MMNKRTLLAGGALAALMLGVLTACGDDDSGDAAAETDGAFIAEMTEHHDSAVEMAQIAKDETEHPEIRRLAGRIIAAQSEESTT
jgi:uncharacterized protein (DUF305 family)